MKYSLVLIASMLHCSSTLAQSPTWSPLRWPGRDVPLTDPQDDIESKRVVWPQPVRGTPPKGKIQVNRDASPARETGIQQAEYLDEVYLDAGVTLESPPAANGPAHQVIAAPTMRRDGRTDVASRPPNHPLHPNYYRLHHPVQAARATIPQARQRATWKTPYSYGYFGASSTRSWSLHNGYRDRYTEWRLK